MINDVIDIKHRNIKDILNAVRFMDGLTKKDISRITDLSFSTVSNLCNELKDLGILSEEKQSSLSIGRIPYELSLNFSDYCVLCIDLQLENTLRFAILDLRNTILASEIVDISDKKNTLEIAIFAEQLINNCISTVNLENRNIIGLGISVPAVYDLLDGKLVNSSVRIFEEAPLKNDFQNIFKLPVYVDNIANFYALSVQTRFPSVSNILCIDISQGVGVGVISEGNLVRGKNGYGSEVAHIPIGNANRKCQFCGGYGCVETELSMAGILDDYSPIDISGPLLARWEKFVDYLYKDQEAAQIVAERVGRLAGKLATILINLFDPELFYVGGYIMDFPAPIEPYMRDEIDLRCARSRDRGLKIQCDKNDMKNIFIGISDTIYKGWNPTEKNNLAF